MRILNKDRIIKLMFSYDNRNIFFNPYNIYTFLWKIFKINKIIPIEVWFLLIKLLFYEFINNLLNNISININLIFFLLSNIKIYLKIMKLYIFTI